MEPDGASVTLSFIANPYEFNMIPSEEARAAAAKPAGKQPT
jgi:hypothetical protein